ncbi:MAG: hemerythrin domain-containing protein [Pseudomonadota bacterium]|nr:hemerythrin domain-containing protein [Pseudomonadota bacterium]
MPTKSKSTNSDSQSGAGSNGSSGESVFGWASGSTGVIVAAAVAGAAVGIAANAGRKLFIQLTSGGATGDWLETIKAEHVLTRGIFDKIEATDDSQTTQRSALLMKLKYALTKHGLEEEMVIYPALRQANYVHDADHLGDEHGYVKTYLYELEMMPKDSPEWLARVRDFRTMIERHMQEEEEEIFPRFHEQLSAEQNAQITSMMNKEGFKHA